jgi:hypothetical protein
VQPEIVATPRNAILVRPAKTAAAILHRREVLKEEGMTDFDLRVDPRVDAVLDFFLDAPISTKVTGRRFTSANNATPRLPHYDQYRRRPRDDRAYYEAQAAAPPTGP